MQNTNFIRVLKNFSDRPYCFTSTPEICSTVGILSISKSFKVKQNQTIKIKIKLKHKNIEKKFKKNCNFISVDCRC